MPWLIRRDYLTNSNDSYWLSSPEQPLEGFFRIIGDEGTERRMRAMLDGRRKTLSQKRALAFEWRSAVVNFSHACEYKHRNKRSACS